MRPDGCSHREGCLKQLIRRHVVQVAVFQTKTVVAFILPLQGSMLPLGVVGTDKMEVFDVLRLSALHTVDCRHARILRLSGRRGSNPRILGWEPSALPLGYARILPGVRPTRSDHPNAEPLCFSASPRPRQRDSTSGILSDHGAGEGDRTLDLFVGNELLYH